MREYKANDRVVRVFDVTAGQTERLPDLLRLLPEFFPGCEKFLRWMERRATQPFAPDADVIPHQWVVDVDGEPAGLVLFDYLPKRGCGLMLFIALYPQYRAITVPGTKRLAHFLIAESVRQISADAAQCGQPVPVGLVVEIEVPALVARYREYDFVELPVVYYEPMFPDPWIAHGGGLDADTLDYERVTLGLFHGGVAPNSALSAQEVAQLALAFLQNFYCLPIQSWPVQRALASAQPIDWT